MLKVLEPICADKTETAPRARIAMILDWGKVQGHQTGDNPARWRGHLQAALSARSQVRKVVHHRALPYIAMPKFMAAQSSSADVGIRDPRREPHG